MLDPQNISQMVERRGCRAPDSVAVLLRVGTATPAERARRALSEASRARFDPRSGRATGIDHPTHRRSAPIRPRPPTLTSRSVDGQGDGPGRSVIGEDAGVLTGAARTGHPCGGLSDASHVAQQWQIGDNGILRAAGGIHRRHLTAQHRQHHLQRPLRALLAGLDISISWHQTQPTPEQETLTRATSPLSSRTQCPLLSEEPLCRGSDSARPHRGDAEDTVAVSAAPLANKVLSAPSFALA